MDTPENTPALVIKNLSFRYHSRQELALDGVSLRLEPGQV